MRGEKTVKTMSKNQLREEGRFLESVENSRGRAQFLSCWLEVGVAYGT